MCRPGYVEANKSYLHVHYVNSRVLFYLVVNSVRQLPHPLFDWHTDSRTHTQTLKLWHFLVWIYLTELAEDERRYKVKYTMAVHSVMSKGQPSRKWRSDSPTTFTFLQNTLLRFAHKVPVVCAKIQSHFDSRMETMQGASNLMPLCGPESWMRGNFGPANLSLMRGNNQKSHGVKSGL